MDYVTIIIPVYNEEEAIEGTLNALLPRAGENGWKVIVVDDGSTDDTRNVLSRFSGIRVIEHPYNKGYGASLKTGINNARTELLVFYDGDGQHCPEDVSTLLSRFHNCDMMVGQRGKDSHQDWIRKPGKWVLSRVANYLTGRKIPDLNSGLRVVKRSIVIGLLHLMPDGFSFTTTSTIAFMNLGYNVCYHPINVRKRRGKSTVSQLKHGPHTLLLILRLILLFNPLKVFIPVSFNLLALGATYEVIYGIIMLPSVRLIPAAFFMILTSILIFFFGMVVDQISELRKHLK